jgi:hypothetical protein
MHTTYKLQTLKDQWQTMAQPAPHWKGKDHHGCQPKVPQYKVDTRKAIRMNFLISTRTPKP